jgi:hydrogenase maturation protease
VPLKIVPTNPNILIAGIGNIFLGDDAFGSEVARRLLTQNWPPNVKIVDFGIRALDLTYALLESWDVVILIDAAPRGGAVGTLYLIEPEPAEVLATSEAMPGEMLIDAHGMDPIKVLRLVHSMGGKINRLLLLACEPSSNADEMEMEMSPNVQAAIPEAVAMIESLVSKLVAVPSTSPK